MIENFTPQAFPLWAVEHGSDVTTLVIGWTLADGVLSPVVVLQDELPTMAPFSLEGGSVVYSLDPSPMGSSAYWRNDRPAQACGTSAQGLFDRKYFCALPLGHGGQHEDCDGTNWIVNDASAASRSGQ